MSNAPRPISQEQLQLVLAVSRLLAVTTDLDPLLAHMAEAATTLLACERASIFLHDPRTKELWTKIALQSKEIRVPQSMGIVGQAFTNNKVIHVADPYNDARFNPEPDRKSGFVTRNLLTAPMLGIDHNPVGVIQAVNKNRGGFDDNDASMMQLLADQAGVAIQRFNLQQEAIESVSLKREMELAKRVQEALIPVSAPEIPGLNAVGWTRAASITGGDCYDLWKLSDGRLGVFMGDASGHGIAPAMVVSVARTLIRALAEIEPNPAKLLEQVNARLCQDLRGGQFVTIFLGYISPDGRLDWTSAGQGPVLVRESPQSPVRLLDPPGYPIGILDSWPAERGEPFHLAPGGELILCSDGILEAFDPVGRQFEVSRVVELLNSNPTFSPAEILAHLRQSVDQWQTRAEPADDQTFVLVRRIL